MKAALCICGGNDHLNSVTASTSLATCDADKEVDPVHLCSPISDNVASSSSCLPHCNPALRSHLTLHRIFFMLLSCKIKEKNIEPKQVSTSSSLVQFTSPRVALAPPYLCVRELEKSSMSSATTITRRADVLPQISPWTKTLCMRALIAFALFRAWKAYQRKKNEQNQSNCKFNNPLSSSPPPSKQHNLLFPRQTFAKGEWKKMMAVAICMVVIAHFRRRAMQSRWLPRGSVPHTIVDHPAFAYVLENCINLGIGFAVCQLRPSFTDPKNVMSNLSNFLKIAGLMVTMDGIEPVIGEVLYGHVPYFSEQHPGASFDWSEIGLDLVTGAIPVYTLASFLQSWYLAHYVSDETIEASVNEHHPEIKLVPFLEKFLIGRVVIDIVFGILHRWLHSEAVYSTLHFVHHQHIAPRFQTNLHFTVPDIFLEAFAPLYCSLWFLGKGLGLQISLDEQILLTMHYFFFEGRSHAGKEIPIATWYPPLSPLVGWLTGCDDRLVEYHTRHHQLYRCNYSISPWWDQLLGTYRIDLPKWYEQ